MHGRMGQRNQYLLGQLTWTCLLLSLISMEAEKGNFTRFCILQILISGMRDAGLSNPQVTVIVAIYCHTLFAKLAGRWAPHPANLVITATIIVHHTTVNLRDVGRRALQPANLAQ